jgi:hypothetical protein
MEIAVKASDDFHQLRKVRKADLLALLNGSYGAATCAASAVNALIGIDLELSIAHADSTNGAISLTCATSNTSITYNICHDIFLLFVNYFFLPAGLSVTQGGKASSNGYDNLVEFDIQAKTC